MYYPNGRHSGTEGGSGPDAMFQGAELTEEQWRFGQVMEREQRRVGRFLDCRDVLRVAKKLGYRKAAH